jgi:hypothetical protein
MCAPCAIGLVVLAPDILPGAHRGEELPGRNEREAGRIVGGPAGSFLPKATAILRLAAFAI